jgi:hypothetical protein
LASARPASGCAAQLRRHCLTSLSGSQSLCSTCFLAFSMSCLMASFLRFCSARVLISSLGVQNLGALFAPGPYQQPFSACTPSSQMGHQVDLSILSVRLRFLPPLSFFLSFSFWSSEASSLYTGKLAWAWPRPRLRSWR